MILAQDYVEIQNLYALYNHCSDEGDGEGYADCFTPDGELRLLSMDIVVSGREALVAYKLADKAARPDTYRRHWNASLHLAMTAPDRVTGRAYYAGYDGTPGETPQMSACGVYADLIEKHDGQWRFARRELVIDGRAG